MALEVRPIRAFVGNLEAMRFESDNDPDEDNMNQIVAWINGEGRTARHDLDRIYIQTPTGGEVRANCGDWIIKSVGGEFVPCDSYAFVALFTQRAE